MAKNIDSNKNRDKHIEDEEKDITDALNRIISKAKFENEALKEMLNKINNEKPENRK